MELTDIAGGMLLPEGPVWLEDGSILITEIRTGKLLRVRPGGDKEVVADLGGGPNGAAIGPDGLAYICNNGGTVWYWHHGRMVIGTPTAEINQGPNYTGGRIERVDLKTGSIELVAWGFEAETLKAPNDVVFDSSGGFWFTDSGKTRARDRDNTGVLYASPLRDPEGNYAVSEKLFPLHWPNGVGLSPDQAVLYVAETTTAHLLAWDLDGPGEPRLTNRYRSGREGRIVAGLLDGSTFDSLAVDSEGNIAVAALGPNGGVYVYEPSGRLAEYIDTHDSHTTNICFGGADMRDAYITCGATGRLVHTRWPVPGAPPAYRA